jgi:LCP family protein required for cell wall assembly
MDRSSEDEGQSSRPLKHKYRKRVLRTTLYTVLSIVAIATVMIAVVLYRLNPTRHFTQKNLPLAATPKPVPPTSPQTGNQTAVQAPTPTASEGKDGIFNLLLLGDDARTPKDAAHTDSIVLAHIDLLHHQYDILSIPRDTRVQLPKYGYTKITHASYLGDLQGGTSQGANDVVQAVSNLTGVAINYYAETNYWGLQDVVNALGGIEMYVPYDMKLGDSWYGDTRNMVISKGNHFFNGELVTEVVHERNTLPNGDFGRQELQKNALVGIANRFSDPTVIMRIKGVIQALPKYLVATNMRSADMLSLAMSAKEFHAQDVHYYQVPGQSGFALDPVVRAQLYYWYPDMNQLRSIISKHFS